MNALNVKELTVELLLRYGFQVLGALAILAVGVVAAKWLGGLADQRFQKQHMEPPMRHLFVRVIKILIVVMAGVVALDKFGFSIAPLVAGIGVAGLGVGFAMQGVLGNLMAGLTLIFTKPLPRGGYIEISEGEAGGIKLTVEPWVRVIDVVPAEAEIYQGLVEAFRARRIGVPVSAHEVRLLEAAVSR